MKTLHIPLTLGRADRVDPKFAPLGVLATAQNLRVRKDGRLACRNGYQPVPMTTPSANLVAYDLIELNGRLLALGTSTGEGYPTDLWEYTTVTPQGGGVWRQGDPASPRTPLGPFSNMRSLAGIPHPEGGVSFIDGAAGAGYVCLSYRTASGTGCNTLIVRQSDDQTIMFERAGNGNLPANALSARLTFAGGKFLLMYADTSTNAINILQFTPGSSTQWTAFATVDGANANVVTAMDLVPVGNPTTAAVVVAFDRSGSVNLDIKAYSSAGAQVGSTISVSGTGTNQISLEADQTANQITMLSRDGATLNLRTFNFSTGAVIAGPTATAAGSTGQIVRTRFTNAMPSNGPAITAVINNSTNGITIQQFHPTTHAVNYSQTVASARLQTRAIDTSGPGSSLLDTVSFGALIGPQIANGGNTEDATNALFTCARSGGFQHVRRNYLNAKAVGAAFGLSVDSSTGKVLWVAGEDDGSELVMPSLALLDFRSAARRQTCEFGGLLYLAGSTPLVYDGRILVEPGFDVPGIISATPSNGIGNLTPLGRYQYVVHFEFTLSNGDRIVGPPSKPFSVGPIGASDDTITVVVQTPHSIPVSVGGAVYGADVTAVLSRTVWDPVTSTIRTELRRSITQSVPTGAANYGATLSIVDVTSDATLATRGVIYTQGDRGALAGPLENNLPQAHSYTIAGEDVILNAGLLRGAETQVSKEAFGGEVINFSEFSSFFDLVSAPIRGIHALDGTKLAFTDDDLWAIDGRGPDDIGGGGFDPPRKIPTSGGLKSWTSFLPVPEGLFFQLDDTKLFLLPRGADSPSWVGKDIEDTLLAYPDISGACRHRKDNASCFAAQNAAGTDARIVVQDMRTGLWSVDTPPLETSQGIEALVNYGQTLAYISNGIVYLQSATGFTDGSSSAIVTQVKTHPLYPFDLGGYGTMHAVLLTGEFRSAGTLALRVSYDDGVSFQTYDSFTIAGLTVGQTVQRRWALQQSEITSVIFEWTFTPSSPGEGFICHSAGILVDPQPNDLKELDPSEMA